jgi:O-antigen ligase
MTTRSALLRTLLVGMASVTAVSLFMTQSRGGVIGLGAAVVAGLLLGGPARVRVLVVFLVVAAAGISYYTFAAPADARERITSFSAESSSGRSDLWAVAVREFETHPTTGVGAGNFVVVKQDYATESVNLTRLDRVVDDDVVVHNTYLEILAELGWVGFLLFATVAVGSLVLGWLGIVRLTAALDVRTALLARGFLTATIGMLAAFTFLSAQFEKNLWLLLGASAAIWSISRRAAEPDDG